MELPDKLEKLKGRVMGGEYHEEAIEQVKKWEDEFLKKVNEKEYFDNPITQSLVKRVGAIVKGINYKLIGEEDLKNRESLIADRKRCLWFISLLARDYSEEIKSIERVIDVELEN